MSIVRRCTWGWSPVLAVLAVVLLTHASAAQKEAAAPQDLSGAYALIVGIADYQMGRDAGYAGRYSLVNLRNGSLDALSARAMFEAAGVPAQNIRLLTDEEATKANIVDGLEWLVQHSAQASRIIYYHSGHGTNAVPDIDGDEAVLDPRDSLDEALVPYDAVDLAQFDRGFIVDNPLLVARYMDRLLLDDELYSYIRRMQAPTVLLIDACFSGGVARGEQRAMLKAVNLVPSGYMDLLPKAGSAASQSAQPDVLPENVTLLAASQEGQPANEIANLGGLYTYWMNRVFTQAEDQLQADQRGNSDGVVQLNEAHDYARERVLSYTSALPDGSIQEPFALNLQAVADLVIAAR